MDMSKRDKCISEKNEDHQNDNNSGGFSSDWQFSNPSVGFVSSNPRVPGQGNQRGSMGDSFNPNLWNTSTSSTNLGLCEGDVPVISKSAAAGTSRIDVCWNPSDSLSRGGSFLPPSLSHFSDDSAFVKRAAMFSCLEAASLGTMANPFSTSHSLSPYSNASKVVADAHIQKIDINTTEYLKDASLSGSPMTEPKRGSLHDVESGEAGFSEDGHENAAEDSSSKGLGAKKRKRSNEDLEVDQTQGDPQMSTETKKENVDAKQKPNDMQAKDASEATKEDYIHVRARRGQATNSHSLAERVRREKISQRMKFLQELVPGCSKVTGKAVMLDEIINYVQSLQRQVEFLSMKLATVNPRLDFNIEALLSKDLLLSHGGPSSAIAFSPDMISPQLHLSQQGLLQTGISGNLAPPNAFRRAAINAPLNSVSGYKGPRTQIPNAWDEQIQNVMQMATFSSNPQQPRTQ